MVGQRDLLDRLHSFTLDTLPKTILLLGECGCGKHTLCQEMGKHFGMPVVDITDSISFESINEIYKSVSPSFYVINMVGLPEKKQNMILKFIEEPLDGAFVVLLSESKSQLLETICNRCYSMQFGKYTEEELAEIAPGVDFVKFPGLRGMQPGKLLSIGQGQYQEALDLADKFVTSLRMASLPNTLTLVGKFNYKDEYDKIDIGMWFGMLRRRILEALKSDFSEFYLTLSELTIEYSKRFSDSRMNKRTLMENYLVSAWSAAKED